MNTPKVAAALNTISLAFGELAEALTEPASLLERIEATPVSPKAPGPSGGPVVPEFPPNDYEDLPVAATAQNEPVLGRCPDHDVAWTVKPGGYSDRLKKNYDAFWKCDEKTGGEFCKKKPVKAWADAHPLT